MSRLDEDESSPVLCLVLAVALFALAWWLYTVIGRYEASGEALRMHRMAGLLYQTAGKWGAVGAPALIGAFFLALSIRNWRRS